MTETSAPTARVLTPTPKPAPARGTVMLVFGVLLFVLGWIVVGTAPMLSTSDSLLSDSIVNIPSLVTKSAGGVVLAVLGAALIAAGTVARRLQAWFTWSGR